ncbi:PREDICTED: condensin-2 complex subunit D3-like [Cyphomyrmex costatus]|uniref:Condensin-2 complex subunit D3 n=1 Tax=Cyphomyrmex costatus TaxID=456900 RepID=A0A151IHF2_9HYME|nr:PREDICTED: condensin-2 complex subunit D3-like [Cyphomyrmex costatus]KYN01400.1 Condensin-2 complex subunit D3 [Cyphomyrmex costatus]
MESFRVFHNFKLDILDESWIKSVWDAEFVIYDEPSNECLDYLESDDVRRLLQESRLELEAWLAANECGGSPEFSWQALMMLNINVRGLLAMLGYIMKTGQQETNKDSIQACLEATSLYLMFLTIPGSSAFRVYHPNLYQRAIDTLKISKSLFSIKSNKEEDDELSLYSSLLHSEKLKLTRGLNRIISNLITMLKSFRFKEDAESLDVTIRILLNITRLEMYVKSHYNSGITSLSQNAFAALQELCNSNHGTVALTIMLIAQYMLPDLSFHHAQPKSITIVHEAAVYFLKNLLTIHEQETVQGIVTLIHQLMVNCPERSEGRQRQAVVIIKLLNICKEDIILDIFRDIILFSHNNKSSYRLFAQEIVGMLLTESFLTNDNLNKNIKMKIRRILIAIVLSRCMDRSALVRGRAMATLALFSDCNNEADRVVLQSIFKVSVSNKTFPMLEDLEEALLKDVDLLPGSAALIAMLLDRINDERALVRRNALKISRNLAIMFPSLVSKMLQVISDRCRDSTLTVRQFAVHILSEILQEFPHNSSLLDEWIQAVVPQIFDIEARVQGKVLECLEDVLINRITNATNYIPNAANSLPWRILNRLSNLRMRKHLSKACSLWVKNGVISESMISNLQSHVGTDNTIGAWILLAALSENMKIPNIRKYITDYKEIIRKNDFHASLVLHVLRHAWSVLDHDCLEDLYQHLHKSICQFEINFNLISICLDILNSILRYLHADQSSHAIESDMVKLMKLSETEIQDLLRENRNCTQDTVKIRAVFTLGHASLFCTNKISSSTLRIFERLLLQWESLPDTVKEMKDLQASAVILLCQQALRDCKVAREVTPILGNVMRQGTNSNSLIKTSVKINAAKALADICVRFTALVEPYLPDLCISMKDPNPAVREAIVVIFIQLLLEDFIKLKGPFFFHILTMLSDTNSMIRELTTFLVEERLLMKNKTLISQQFLDSIYHYNNYHSRNAYTGHRMLDQEMKLLTLPGRANEKKRNVIYEFMLEHLDMSAKFELVTKLTKHIFREVCDGNSIDVTIEEGACVLKDALFILNNNRLQLSSGERHRDDTELDETSSTPSSTPNNASNVIITGLKKHNLDNLLPTIIMLKKKLVALKFPLKEDVDKLLFKIYSEYDKEQLVNLLDEYPELEKEMDSYQRRLKDKINSENNGESSSSANIGNNDSLIGTCKRATPRVLLHRISPSLLTSSYDKLIASPVHLERLLLQTPPPEPSFITSTPTLTQNLNSSDFLTSRKRSNEQEISPDISRKNLKVSD